MFRAIFFISFLFLFTSCERELPDNCEGRYSLKVPYNISHPTGRLKMGDTLTLHLEIPINVYNYYSDSIVNINRFSKLLCGFTVSEFIKDSTNGVGIKSIHAKNEFIYYSQNIVPDLTEGVGGRSRVRYYLKKTDSSFVCTINLIPKRKGIFNINLLNGVIEDAFCISGIEASWTDSISSRSFQNFKAILISFDITFSAESLELHSKTTSNYNFFVE